MDAHRLWSVLDLVIAEHRRLEIEQKLARIQETLDESASNPSAASDERFRSALTSLLTALRGMRVADLVESDRRILKQIEGGRFTGEGLAERVLAIANERPFLPARAGAAFGALATELEGRFRSLAEVHAGLLALNVGPVEREADTWELGILLPKHLIRGELPKLLAELKEWDQSLRELLPLFAAGPTTVTLRTHSTDRFELAVVLDRERALAVGEIVARIYDMFRQVRANRERAADLEKQSYPTEIVSRVTAYEQQIVSAQLKAIKEELTKRYVRSGAGKPKEVDRVLDKGLRFMAIRIREGVDVELVGPPVATAPEAPESGGNAVIHHVRAALQAARDARAQAPSGEGGQAEAQAPRLPLSKIAEQSDEAEKKAA